MKITAETTRKTICKHLDSLRIDYLPVSDDVPEIQLVLGADITSGPLLLKADDGWSYFWNQDAGEYKEYVLASFAELSDIVAAYRASAA